MSNRVQDRGTRLAGGTGSGTGPGIDFVSALFATTGLDEIGQLAAREAESRFELRNLKLHWVPTAASNPALPHAPTAAVVPLHPRRPALDKQHLQFDLVGTPAGTWLSADVPPPGSRFDANCASWQDFLVLISARVRTALELRDQQLATDRMGKAARLQAALYAVANLASARLEMADMLRRIHEVIGELMFARNCYIALYDHDKEVLRFIYFVDERDDRIVDPEHEYPVEQMQNSLTLGVIRSGQPALGPSSEVAHAFGLVVDEAAMGPDSADWLGVPLVDDGIVRGAIVLQSYDQPNRYSPDDQALLQFVSHHILIALTRRQARDELERRVEERTQALTEEIRERKRGAKLQAALYSIADLASSQLSMEDMLRQIHLTVGELMYARNFFIAMYEPVIDSIRFIYFADAKDTNMYQVDHAVPAEQMKHSLTLGLIRHGKPVRGPARKVAEELGIATGIGLGTPALDFLGVPIIDGTGVRGAIVVQTYDAGVHYTMEDSALLAYVAQHIMTALERKKQQAELERQVVLRTQELASAVAELREQITVREHAEQRLQHEALHDALTGLPNRACLIKALEHALAVQQRDPHIGFAVLFLDLDRFKVINDSVGHMFGDMLLQQAATRLAGNLRTQDMVARLGGDEFAILMTGIDGPEDACHTAQRLIHALSEPMLVGGKELYTSASIGISLGSPRYRHAEELLRDADVAMYRAKGRGRHCFALFDEQLHLEALQLLELENELRQALQRHQFCPYFQPIVHLESGMIAGYESLLRWNHPRHGILPPGNFLKVAEDTGLIEQIDWQMLTATCQQIPALAAHGRYVTLNVSPRRFLSSDLADSLLAEMDMLQVAHHSIRIEITEDAMLGNPDQVLTTLGRLRDAGVLAALDDFGTGYSSLSYLHRFPLHALKIDRSFVRDLQPDGTGGSAAVVRAVVAMADSLGLEVIAEGVETPAQRKVLMALGCKKGQGFLFGPGRPAAEWQAHSGRFELL